MNTLLNKLQNGITLDSATIGKSARQTAIFWALHRSPYSRHCSALSEVVNPNLTSFGTVRRGVSNNKADVLRFAHELRPDFIVVGPEEPLAAGAVDWLGEIGIPCVGPTQSLARIESSKAFARGIIDKYHIAGNPEYKIFSSAEGLKEYMDGLGDYVVKPDVLTGGKGVKVSGDHLQTADEGVEYAKLLIRSDIKVIIEEKLDGEEFSLQSFCDGHHLRHMPIVQDHKRAQEGDRGPNTGGMGSYSCSNFTLPFLSKDEVEAARRINEEVAAALLKETGEPYKGILYGSFISTTNGLKIIEYNARFGDPECLNVLSILETDFVEICAAIIDGRLDKVPVAFSPKATVCKYVVPEGYPDAPVRDTEIQVPPDLTESDHLRIFYGAVDNTLNGELLMTGSRAIAFVGIGDTVQEAERIAEAAVRRIKGPVFHRRDIGTTELIDQRVRHMEKVRSQTGFLSEILSSGQIPEAKLAYFRERLRNRIHQFILREFMARQQEGLEQADVARALDCRPEQINKWLSSPGNLELDSISDLMLAISKSELDFKAEPLEDDHVVDKHTDRCSPRP